MKGSLAATAGIGCAALATLLPLPSLATMQFARAVETNAFVHLMTSYDMLDSLIS